MNLVKKSGPCSGDTDIIRSERNQRYIYRWADEHHEKIHRNHAGWRKEEGDAKMNDDNAKFEKQGTGRKIYWWKRIDEIGRSHKQC